MSAVQPNFYAIIPANIRYSKNLEMGAKLLYGEITSLTHSEGYCWATNQYFADLYSMDVSTIKRWIASLKKNNFIYTQTEKNGINSSRKIWIYPDVKKMFTKAQKCATPRLKNEPLILNKNNKEEKDKKENTSSAIADSLSNIFFKKIKEKKPNFSGMVNNNWVKCMTKLLEIRSKEHIENLMDFVLGDSFWFGNCLSPSKLIKHLDILEIQIKTKKNSHHKIVSLEENKKWLDQEIQKIPNSTKKNCINMGYDYVEFIFGYNHPGINIKFTDPSFKEQVINALRKITKDLT